MAPGTEHENEIAVANLAVVVQVGRAVIRRHAATGEIDSSDAGLELDDLAGLQQHHRAAHRGGVIVRPRRVVMDHRWRALGFLAGL